MLRNCYGDRFYPRPGPKQALSKPRTPQRKPRAGALSQRVAFHSINLYPPPQFKIRGWILTQTRPTAGQSDPEQAQRGPTGSSQAEKHRKKPRLRSQAEEHRNKPRPRSQAEEHLNTNG